MCAHQFSNVEPKYLIEPIKHSQAANEWEEQQAPEGARTHAPEYVPWYYDPLVAWNDKAPSQRQSEGIKQQGSWTET